MSRCWPHPIKAILFDNDGTFLDTMGVFIEAMNNAIGQPMTQEFINRVNGMETNKVSKEAILEYRLNLSLDEFNQKRDFLLCDLLLDCKPFSGVVELAKNFKNNGYKIGLATSDTYQKTKIKFSKKPDVWPVFDVVMTRDDVKQAKPDPEIFLKCAKRLGINDPANVLVFEDAVNGIKAANSAGMASAFFANGNSDCEKYFEKYGGSPSYIFQKYEDFDMSKFIWYHN
ncbi:Pseudouridine-5'-phosphatase [Tritrichomonas musculus]|uniref:Pseudouridine-5'-phosphatase n=1 Tax=Tritrichomonas musculus TaxID=1915356 RepID=A0ABR2J0F5_9EUKA